MGSRMMHWMLYILIALSWPSMVFCEEAYSLLWQHAFDSTIVKTSMIKDFTKRTSAFPLNHVATKKNMIELDMKTKKEKNRSLKNYDIVKVADNNSIAVGVKKNRVTVFTIDKEVSSFKLDKTILIPEHLIMDISPDGSLIVIVSWFHKSISFYSIKGQLLSSYSSKDLKGAVIQFSRNSKHTVIHVPNYGDGSGNGYLLCYDAKGQFLWRYDHPGNQAQYDLSSDGAFVILYANQILYSLHKGKSVYEINMNSPDILPRISNDGC
ncbi:hypothetical protein MHK_003767 [Candidatus Magnetomorum sp. HK-1]|nr:hypothetical protein MHK_003767 [Candidatus Magnetomorum sp. HK-1]